jgi:hypothetical protein
MEKRPGGAFANYLKCHEHNAPPSEYRQGCLSCEFAEDHNWQIFQEIAAEKGWLLAEPAGDVPLDRWKWAPF